GEEDRVAQGQDRQLGRNVRQVDLAHALRLEVGGAVVLLAHRILLVAAPSEERTASSAIPSGDRSLSAAWRDSRASWHARHRVAKGTAFRRASAISAPHCAQAP